MREYRFGGYQLPRSPLSESAASAGFLALTAAAGPAEYEDYSDDYSDDSDDESTEEEDWADGGPDPDFANREAPWRRSWEMRMGSKHTAAG